MKRQIGAKNKGSPEGMMSLLDPVQRYGGGSGLLGGTGFVISLSSHGAARIELELVTSQSQGPRRQAAIHACIPS